MKVCTKCKVEKEDQEFHKDLRKKTGLFTWCKLCVCLKAKQNRWLKSRNKRIEFFKQLRRQWDLDHPGARKEKDKIYLKLLVAKIERLL